MAELTVRSEVTGSIWKILVAEGESVSEDQTLAIAESMKMEIPLTATDDGKVLKIFVKEGDSVAEGDPVLSIELR